MDSRTKDVPRKNGWYTQIYGFGDGHGELALGTKVTLLMDGEDMGDLIIKRRHWIMILKMLFF